LAAVESGSIASIGQGESLVLDTSVVIAYLNGQEAASGQASVILDEMVGTGRNPAVISAITVGELLVRPLRLGPLPSTIKTFLLGFPGLAIRSADFLIAAEAARIRASTGNSLPDALIAATATLTSSPWLITADRVLHDRLRGHRWNTEVVVIGESAAGLD
jgi:predicted nucleic acid-binding protein